MALQQHHLLSDVAVRGFVAGATNILFRQQRHLSDAVIDVSAARTKSLGDLMFPDQRWVQHEALLSSSFYFFNL